MTASRVKLSFYRPAAGYRLVFGYLGLFFILVGVVCLLPLAFLPFYPEEANVSWSFVIPGGSSIVVGLLLYFLLIFKKERDNLGKHQDSVLLVLVWMIAILIGSVPFMLRGFPNNLGEYAMNANDAIFESASGYTATGFSLFNFDTNAPGYHIYVIYRTILIFFGGIGLVLVVTSALSDRYGLKLYSAEGHNDKLLPNLAKSARLILGLFTGFIAVGSFFYWIVGGLTWFDAINHSVCAVATGGFSTVAGGLPQIIADSAYVNEIGLHPNGLAINIVSMVLMIMGATNFLLHLFLLSFKFKLVFKDIEMKFFLVSSIFFISLMIVALVTSGSFTVGESFEQGSVLFLSALTTTGFNISTPINNLPSSAIAIVIIAMIIGGGAGSTAGAIKQYRIAIAIKSTYYSIRDRLANRRKLFPHPFFRLGSDHELDQDTSNEAFSYIFIYLVILFVGTIGITLVASISGLNDIHFGSSIFEFSSAMAGVGLTIGVVGQSVVINWILIIGMFLGRLEILPVSFAIYRVARDIARKETN